MNTDSLLIELGTEELPPKALKKLSDAFSAELLNGLAEAELMGQQQREMADAFATPDALLYWCQRLPQANRTKLPIDAAQRYKRRSTKKAMQHLQRAASRSPVGLKWLIYSGLKQTKASGLVLP